MYEEWSGKKGDLFLELWFFIYYIQVIVVQMF